jgi:hypothetical protein
MAIPDSKKTIVFDVDETILTTANRDYKNSQPKAEVIEGFIERVPGRTRHSSSGTGKPAQLYRRGKAEKLDPPLIIPRRATKPAKRPAK